MWPPHLSNKKRKLTKADEEPEELELPFNLPALFGGGSAHITVQNNNVYFNDDITSESASMLNKELRHVEEKMVRVGEMYKITPPPIYLYLTTNGGDIYSAFSVIDCITRLKVDVYTVVDGFVASAGTLISLAGKKRFILPNAYMLIHELRSGVWGKMSDMTDEYENLKKLMDHLTDYYVKHTKITKKTLEKILKKDSIWNAEECMRRGLVEETL